MSNLMTTQPGLSRPEEEAAPREQSLQALCDSWPDASARNLLTGGEAAVAEDGARSEICRNPTFDMVLTTHQAEIYRFAVYLTGNQPDADDLFQETMLKAFRAFGRLPADANHRAWLYRIATNAFLDDRRKLARVQSLAPDHEVVVADSAAEIADRLDARDVLDAVWAMITTLPPKQRIAFVLRKYHGQEYYEIAAVLRTTPAAARANVHEALRKLRAAFGDQR
jgi:RNA polymerase sigma factor (sigma-70 family)